MKKEIKSFYRLKDQIKQRERPKKSKERRREEL